MPKLINPAIIGNWENWIRVYLMFLIGFMAFDYGMRYIHQAKGSDNGK